MSISEQLSNNLSAATSDLLSDIVHPIYYPRDETEQSLRTYLKGFRLDNAENNELDNYLK